MKLLHASPNPDLHKLGITPNANKTCCRFNDGYVYLADLNYLESQYFQYCPKGIYYIFEVDIPESCGRLEYMDRVNHYRHYGPIDKNIKPHSVRFVKG
jgi:hypothetical protein